jgi:hypothetical protein
MGTIFSVVIPYSSLRTRRFGGTYSIFRAGEEAKQTSSELPGDATVTTENLKYNRDFINRRMF